MANHSQVDQNKPDDDEDVFLLNEVKSAQSDTCDWKEKTKYLEKMVSCCFTQKSQELDLLEEQRRRPGWLERASQGFIGQLHTNLPCLW